MRIKTAEGERSQHLINYVPDYVDCFRVVSSDEDNVWGIGSFLAHDWVLWDFVSQELQTGPLKEKKNSLFL